MATALPVLVPDSGGIREAVDDGVTGFVYPALNHEALAAAMCKLHLQPDLRRAMGIAARHSAEQRFTVERYVQRLYGIYGINSDPLDASQE
jgi:glycosyltransferase involved in cell wall biosynthesis